jgi:hypothetical protein
MSVDDFVDIGPPELGWMMKALFNAVIWIRFLSDLFIDLLSRCSPTLPVSIQSLLSPAVPAQKQQIVVTDSSRSCSPRRQSIMLSGFRHTYPPPCFPMDDSMHNLRYCLKPLSPERWSHLYEEAMLTFSALAFTFHDTKEPVIRSHFRSMSLLLNRPQHRYLAKTPHHPTQYPNFHFDPANLQDTLCLPFHPMPLFLKIKVISLEPFHGILPFLEGPNTFSKIPHTTSILKGSSNAFN